MVSGLTFKGISLSLVIVSHRISEFLVFSRLFSYIHVFSLLSLLSLLLCNPSLTSPRFDWLFIGLSVGVNIANRASACKKRFTITKYYQKTLNRNSLELSASERP